MQLVLLLDGVLHGLVVGAVEGLAGRRVADVAEQADGRRSFRFDTFPGGGLRGIVLLSVSFFMAL